MTLLASKADMHSFMSKITIPWIKIEDDRGVFEIRCLGENRAPNYNFFPTSQISAACDYACSMNELRLNVYMTINPVGAYSKVPGKSSKDANILRAHYSFADADDAVGAAGLTQLCSKVQPDIVVVTGLVPYERRHAYWRLHEPCDDLIAWTAVQQTIASKFKTDKTVSNPSRIMRVPGTISFPPERKQARGYIAEIVTLREAW
jgi:hypothetical protein